MPELDLPMRWADLDSLHHVNNVVYLDYAAEARARLIADGVVGADESVTDVTVRFLRPMLLSRAPVTVVSTVEHGELIQIVRGGQDGERTDHARIVTRYGRRQDATPQTDLGPSMPVRVRHSDIGQDGAVRLARVFELFQEARILALTTRLGWLTAGSFVIGTSAVTPRRSIRWQEEPYDAVTWLSRVGRSSVEVRCQLSDGAHVLADSTTVLVGFDIASQSSRVFADDERAGLERLVRTQS